MRNLSPYDQDTTDFFDRVVSNKKLSKNDPNLLKRIESYRPNIILAYAVYNKYFLAHTLMSSNAIGHLDPTKTDLIKLYSYKAKIFKELKLKLTTDENNRIINTCQNCTINEVNSFDHVLPKDEFPEFAVNPQNLFPSCTQCNGYKSYIWRHQKIGLFLNLFLDILPSEQYLFSNIKIIDNTVVIKYVIENRNGLDDTLFNLIQSHYNRLHLTERFSGNCNDIITELINSILAIKNELSKEKIIEVTIAKAKRDLNKFGHNYWKAITVISLITSDDFFEYTLQQEDQT